MPTALPPHLPELWQPKISSDLWRSSAGNITPTWELMVYTTSFSFFLLCSTKLCSIHTDGSQPTIWKTLLKQGPQAKMSACSKQVSEDKQMFKRNYKNVNKQQLTLSFNVWETISYMAVVSQRQQIGDYCKLQSTCPNQLRPTTAR